MAETRPALRAVDRLEVTILVDNNIDVFLPSTREVRRTRLPSELPWGEGKALVAEHGYSALVSVHAADHSATLLFDAGVGTQGLTHNMDVMELSPTICTALSLAMAMLDHTQGLMGMIKRVGKQRMPILLHPDAFLNRKVVFLTNQSCTRLLQTVAFIGAENVGIYRRRGPSIWSNGWCW
jgi:7,8-dihydropterin-6-yl-methyl-4-(beta-D-ribofuranosyl)aminobenzene 5'-phosphate synthase